MSPRIFLVRRGMVHLIIQAAFFALCLRMAVVQCLYHEHYAALAGHMEHATVARPARRGSILDRNGHPLAVTVPAQSIWANPRAIAESERTRVAEQLGETLDLPPGFVAERLARKKYFVWIQRRVSDEQAERVHALNLPGVAFVEENTRRYPNGASLCHVLGFVGADQNGLAGLEAEYDSLLTGQPGEESVLRDGLGRRVGLSETPAKPVRHGRSLALTVDTRLQRIVEEELAELDETHRTDAVSAVVMDPWTGDVLAMAARPAFNPARFSDASVPARENRAVTVCLEPGSSFKPIVVAAALAYGVVTPETIFDCHQGRYRIGSRVLHDAHPLGRLSVRDVIAYSSNIGMAQICARMTPDDLYEALRAFGFGQRTGIEFPGESAGILHPTDRWSGLSASSLAMGQEVSVTPMQLTAAFCVFANGGWLVQPRLVLGILSNDGKTVLHQAVSPARRKILDDATARLLCNDLLAGVVERGTARRAALDGYRLAGKTGTAQIARTNVRGYEPGAYSAVFVGIVPAEAPRFVIGLMAQRPKGPSHYGGIVAAPAVARIAERMLAVRRVPRAARVVPCSVAMH